MVDFFGVAVALVARRGVIESTDQPLPSLEPSKHTFFNHSGQTLVMNRFECGLLIL